MNLILVKIAYDWLNQNSVLITNTQLNKIEG